MAFDRITCPTCLTSDLTQLGSNSTFRAVSCCRCGLGIECQVAIDPSAYGIVAYAKSRDGGDTNANPFRRWHHDVSVAHDRIEQLRPHVREKGTWLDVGCNAGAMLSAVGRFDWTPIGVEIDHASVALIRATTGHQAITTKKWFKHQCVADVVSMFDVLEHGIDPPRMITKAAECLANADQPDGVGGATFVVEVPDLEACPDFDRWRHRRITTKLTEHVYHFNEQSLGAMVKRYAPDLRIAAIARPVDGKLQMVFRTGAA